LADADNPDSEFTQVQIRRFQDLAGRLKAGGLKIPLLHVANSSAVLRYPDAHGTAVRPGLMLYGYHMTPHAADAVDLRPVLSLTTRVIQVRTLAPGQAVGYNRTWSAPSPARLAVLPVGYADGYSRALSNRGAVLLHGVQAGIIGRVCMDFTMVDITRVPQVRPGDEAVLIGRQGTEHLSAHDLAAWMGTIPYEVLCTLGQRVARRYLPGSPLTERKSR
ncbi:MAG: alanine racemase, partial [Nitrospirales bacterium]